MCVLTVESETKSASAASWAVFPRKIKSATSFSRSEKLAGKISPPAAIPPAKEFCSAKKARAKTAMLDKTAKRQSADEKALAKLKPAPKRSRAEKSGAGQKTLANKKLNLRRLRSSKKRKEKYKRHKLE